jgi:actin-like ATPase involved in cell morphogenesis
VSYGLGVDLGTTYTAAAVRIDGGVEVVPLGGRRPEIPSLVFVPASGPVLIGEAAERRGAAEPGRLAREFKRRLGDPVPVLIGGSPYPAHALIARVLAEVYAVVGRLRQAPPDWVTVTHPANWGPYKLELLEQAVRLADLTRVAFRPEPEAAAVQYAADARLGAGEVIAVYDLGGGTFDAAVLRRTADGFALLGEPEGIEQLGGVDFDEAVFGHVLSTLGDAVGRLDPDDEEVTAAVSRLRRDCVEAKESLSYDTETMIPVALPGLHTRVRLNRSEFEAMITPALAETARALDRALRSAGVTPTDLRCVLLVGGSSRIPLVRQLLEAEFDRPAVLDARPEQTVALGAARLTGAAPRPAPGPAPVGSPPPAAPPLGSPSASPSASSPAGRRYPWPAGTPSAGDPPVGAPPVSGPPVGAAPVSGPSPVGPSTGEPSAVTEPIGIPPVGIPPVGIPPVGIPPVSGPPVSPGPVGVPPFGGGVASTERIPPVGGPPGRGEPATFAPPGGVAATPAAPPAPIGPDRRRAMARRTLLIGVPSVVALAGVGAAAALVANAGDDAGGPDPAGSPAGSPTPAATSAPPAPMPTDAMVVQENRGGGGTPVTTRVYRTTPGGGQRTQLAGSGADTLPQWSHDRRSIVYLRRRGKVWEIVYVRADGSGRMVLVAGLDRETRLTWSPDDRRVAYVAMADGRIQVHVSTVGQARPRRLTGTPELKWDPAWAPHDENLMLMSPTAQGRRDIVSFRVDAPDTSRAKLTSVRAGANAIDPAWSPDGRLIAYSLVQADGGAAIRVMNADGTADRAVTSDADRNDNPSWSPDGTWIAFGRPSGTRAVFAIRPDGTGLRRLTAASVFEVYASWS